MVRCLILCDLIYSLVNITHNTQGNQAGKTGARIAIANRIEEQCSDRDFAAQKSARSIIITDPQQFAYVCVIYPYIAVKEP